MAVALYFIYTIIHIGLLVWGIRLWRQARSIRLLLILLPIAGLIYDNAVIAVGVIVGEGSLLEMMNNGRYLLHAIITPMLIMAAVDLARRAGVGLANNRIVYTIFGLLTVGLMAFGLLEWQHMVFAPERYAGSLRYVDVAVAGPPIPAIVTIFVILGWSIGIWRSLRWPWLFVGALVMFLGSAIPPSVVGPAVGSGAEVVLLASLLATEWRVQQVETAVSDVQLDGAK